MNASIKSWTATDSSERELNKEEACAAGLDSMRLFKVLVSEEGAEKELKILVDPKKGQAGLPFTRVLHLTGQGRVDVPVLQIRPDPQQPELFVRLYFHPVHGLVLTTQDLYAQ